MYFLKSHVAFLLHADMSTISTMFGLFVFVSLLMMDDETHGFINKSKIFKQGW